MRFTRAAHLLAVAACTACILVGFAFQLSFSRKTAIAALEARSMIFGAISFLVYACAVCQVTMRYKLPAWIVASASIRIWLALAFGLETAIGR